MFPKLNLNKIWAPRLFHKLSPGAMAPRRCFLVRVETDEKIELPADEPKILGRSVETGISDPFVSRRQIECLATVSECTVQVRALGANPSSIEGYSTMRGRRYVVGHGRRIGLLHDKYSYEIRFEPAPERDDGEAGPAAKRFKLDVSEAGGDVSGTWENRKELLIFNTTGSEARSKIAGFDMDGTLIKTKSGKRFPIDYKDWVLNFPDSKITGKLKDLIKKGFKIVIFTNQSGINKDHTKVKDFQTKIEDILKVLRIPCQVFVSLGKGIYRKPLPGMWNLLQEDMNDNVKINISESFYVGDAAGRTYNNNKKDHSIVDRLFAKNIGLPFYTPEEYFTKTSQNHPYKMPDFDPKALPDARYPQVNHTQPNVILMVGLPASGKSHFCKKILTRQGYTYINRDTLGSWQKCIKALEEALGNKKSCVIDNTNVDKESRKRYLEATKKFNVKCYCYVMTTDIHHVRHNNKFRDLTDKSHVPVNDMIIYSARKNYEEPQESEGFESIVKVPFVPDFKNEEEKGLYNMFLLEK